jgi:hypothetical protein
MQLAVRHYSSNNATSFSLWGICHGCHPSANVIKLAVTSTRSLAYKGRRNGGARGGEKMRGKTERVQ